MKRPDLWRTPVFVELARVIEVSPRLGGLVEAVEGVTRMVESPRLHSRLRGEWLGHALHPLLTDLPLGCWFSAIVLDLTGRDRAASRRLIGAGLLLVPVTVAAGLAEWGLLRSHKDKNVGAVHAAGNGIAAMAFLLSWWERGKGRRGMGWSLFGGAVSVVTGYLGGHLSFGMGAGVGARGEGASSLAPAPGRAGGSAD